MSIKLKSAFEKWWTNRELQQWTFGKLGKVSPNGGYTFDVPGRATFVYVTIRSTIGAQTVVAARNDAGVPHAPRLNVRMKMEYGVYVIYGQAGRQDLGENPVSDPSGILPHDHDANYYEKFEYVDASAGVGNAGNPVKLNADGIIDPSMISIGMGNLNNTNALAPDSGDVLQFNDFSGLWEHIQPNALGLTLDDMNGVNVPTPTAEDILSFHGGEWVNVAVIPVPLAATIHAATIKATPVDADELALDDSAASFSLKKLTWANLKSAIATYYNTLAVTLTNKTLDSTNISTLTSKTTPVDADSVVLVDSAASNIFKRVTGTNWKAYMKTYFDTLYLSLAGGNLTGVLDMGSHKITTLTDPTNAQDAATKAYVDSIASGLDVKASVRVATTANITLSGAQTIDGVSAIAGDRVLVKDQSTGANNGIYVVASGSWARATDADASAEVTSGMFTFVAEGTVNGDTAWALTTNDPITLGTTALVFTQFSGPTNLAALIHAATSKTTPVDADELALIDSAASNVLKKLTWANLKTTLRTAFDLVYGLLGTANTWTANNAFNSTDTSGNALSVTRNLASGSTDSPVAYVHQDNSGDDQPALLIQQDATAVAFRIQGDPTSSDMEFIVGAEAAKGYFALFTGGIVQLAVNRRINGTFSDTAKAAAAINLTSNSADGNVAIYTASANNTSPSLAALFDKLQRVIVGGLTAAQAGATWLAVRAGTSSNDAAVGGILYEDHAVTGQVGAGPDTLSTYGIPANTLAVNGQSIHWRAAGVMAVGVTSGVIKIVYGATTILEIDASPAGNGAWFAEGDIIRTGATAQRSIAWGFCDQGSTKIHAISDTTPAETLGSGTVTLKVTGNSSSNANNDTVSHMLKVFFDDANT